MLHNTGDFMEEFVIQIKKLREDAIIPSYRHEGDAGFDLHVVENVTVPAGGVKILPTGLALALPDGFEMQVRLRSGAALQTPLILPNAPATIDAGYRGEIGIIVRNVGQEDFTVQKGDRIAQGVLARVSKAAFAETTQLPDSSRGDGGYGSTGR